MENKYKQTNNLRVLMKITMSVNVYSNEKVPQMLENNQNIFHTYYIIYYII